MKVLSKPKLKLVPGRDAVVSLPNGRRLKVALLQVMPDGRYKMKVSINRPGKADYLPLLQVVASAGDPFFLVLSHYAVHTPLQGKSDKVSRYEKVPASRRQGKPAYAAMVESVDESVGRVTKTLRELDLE